MKGGAYFKFIMLSQWQAYILVCIEIKWIHTLVFFTIFFKNEENEGKKSLTSYLLPRRYSSSKKEVYV